VVRDYELMYIVRPDLDDEALRTATESVDTLIRGLGGTVGKTTMWGKRRLAYEVDRLRDGHYVITLIQLDGARVADLERALQIHDTVFRHLLVRRDETADVEPGDEDEAGLIDDAAAPASTRPGAVPDELRDDDDVTEVDDDEVPPAAVDEDEE